MHFDFQQAVAGACLTASAFYVERKSSRPIAAHFRILCLCKQRADVIEQSGIRGRIGARRTSNGGLVNINHLIQMFHADNFTKRARPGFRAIEISCQLFIQDLVDE